MLSAVLYNERVESDGFNLRVYLFFIDFFHFVPFHV